MNAPRLSVPPPLRFLALVVGGWICLRAAVLLSDSWTGPRTVPPSPPPASTSPLQSAQASISEALMAETATAGAAGAAGAGRFAARANPSLIRAFPHKGRLRPLSLPPGRDPDFGPGSFPPAGPQPSFPAGLVSPTLATETSASAPPLRLGPAASDPPRWSGSAWALLRHEPGGSSLAPGGTLGGSQAGARLLYRTGAGLALSGRAYALLRRPRGAELAVGLDWRPVAAIPLNLLAERRQALGHAGRSAFSLTVYGGTSRTLARSLRLDTYVQAGIVGLGSRDLFIDGAARVGAPLGPLEVGAGAWGAAQPGAARLDAGPTLSYRLPAPRAHLRLEAAWRVRIAGDAAPGSGPALTLAADF